MIEYLKTLAVVSVLTLGITLLLWGIAFSDMTYIDMLVVWVASSALGSIIIHKGII